MGSCHGRLFNTHITDVQPFHSTASPNTRACSVYRLSSLESADGRCGIQDGEHLLLWDLLGQHLRRLKLISLSQDDTLKFSVDNRLQIILYAHDFIYVLSCDRKQVTRNTIGGDRVIVWNVEDKFAEQECITVVELKATDKRLFVLTLSKKYIIFYTFNDTTRQSRVMTIGTWKYRKKSNYSMCCITALSDGSAVFSTDDRVVQWDPRKPTKWNVVAGGNGMGASSRQLNWPFSCAEMSEHELLIADTLNDRLIKWTMGEQTGTVVATTSLSVLQYHWPFHICQDSEGKGYTSLGRQAIVPMIRTGRCGCMRRLVLFRLWS